MKESSGTLFFPFGSVQEKFCPFLDYLEHTQNGGNTHLGELFLPSLCALILEGCEVQAQHLSPPV